MKAIQYVKSVSRYLAVRLLGPRRHSSYTSNFSMIRMVDLPEPILPNPNWLKIKTKLCGICGSDLATITAKGSPYFSPLTSTPFVLGHEVLGEIAEIGENVDDFQIGDRVVIEPILSCEIRNIDPFCYACDRGNFANCENITRGEISAGIQTGYCRDTGGGWSSIFLAHKNQIHRVPDELDDEIAVLIEPFACALHAVLKADLKTEDPILIIGAGSIGLLTLAAIRAIGKENHITIIAKHPHQQKIAQELGANEILKPDRALYRKFCELTNAESHQPELGKPIVIGGVNVTFDCVASSTTIDDAIRFTRGQGRVILVGMPSIPKNVDWTSIWYQELDVIGAYTYGVENFDGETIRTFDLGIRLLQKMGDKLRPIIGDRFPISEYRKAIQTALHSSRSGSIKTLFEF